MPTVGCSEDTPRLGWNENMPTVGCSEGTPHLGRNENMPTVGCSEDTPRLGWNENKNSRVNCAVGGIGTSAGEAGETFVAHGVSRGLGAKEISKPL